MFTDFQNASNVFGGARWCLWSARYKKVRILAKWSGNVHRFPKRVERFRMISLKSRLFWNVCEHFRKMHHGKWVSDQKVYFVHTLQKSHDFSEMTRKCSQIFETRRTFSNDFAKISLGDFLGPRFIFYMCLHPNWVACRKSQYELLGQVLIPCKPNLDANTCRV